MSRAVNVNATQAEVTAMCAKHKVNISTIEPLHPAGTRVVLLNAHDAHAVAKAYSGKILSGPLVRTPLKTR